MLPIQILKELCSPTSRKDLCSNTQLLGFLQVVSHSYSKFNRPLSKGYQCKQKGRLPGTDVDPKFSSLILDQIQFQVATSFSPCADNNVRLTISESED